MSFRLLTATALLALTFASAAAAQDSPILVGIPSDAKNKARHCTAALMGERYLVEQEGRATTLDRDRLEPAARAWAMAGAREAGVGIESYMQNEDLAALTEYKMDRDAERTRQATWCLDHLPS